ncbi:MAG: hypothetical protein K2X69_02255 [Silvanigrellaceae bacterium]|nr:hypothetical protein [Silvanigrellaceae bacterium]
MKNLKYVLPLLFVSNFAYSADFCKQLLNKLQSENYSQSIIHRVYFNYSVFNYPNYGMGVEYKYDVETNYDDNNYTELNEDDLFSGNYSSNTNNSSTSSSYLSNCRVYNNNASFSIKLVSPGLKLSSPAQPKFNIQFEKSSNRWSVSSISSYDFENLYHSHLSNSFREYSKTNHTSYSNSFYTVGLKNMVENDIYPSLKNTLKNEFNSKIRNFN